MSTAGVIIDVRTVALSTRRSSQEPGARAANRFSPRSFAKRGSISMRRSPSRPSAAFSSADSALPRSPAPQCARASAAGGASFVFARSRSSPTSFFASASFRHRKRVRQGRDLEGPAGRRVDRAAQCVDGRRIPGGPEDRLRNPFGLPLRLERETREQLRERGIHAVDLRRGREDRVVLPRPVAHERARTGDGEGVRIGLEGGVQHGAGLIQPAEERQHEGARRVRGRQLRERGRWISIPFGEDERQRGLGFDERGSIASALRGCLRVGSAPTARPHARAPGERGLSQCERRLAFRGFGAAPRRSGIRRRFPSGRRRTPGSFAAGSSRAESLPRSFWTSWCARRCGA
jgi:hypothetical protein